MCLCVKKNETMKNIPAFLIAYSDSDFTNPHELVLQDEPKDCREYFTHMGVKYTGLETSRHLNTHVNQAQKRHEYYHDQNNWAKIGLKERALIKEIKVSTLFFTGNQVRAISVVLKDELSGQETRVLERVNLAPDSNHTFPIDPVVATECLIEMYYEGGITRINLFGTKEKEQLPQRENLLEKATISHVSNEHYGHPRTVVVADRKEMYMVGWESARTGFGEQALFQLEKASVINEIVVDTYLHRLNPPLSCHVFGLNMADGDDIDKLMEQKPRWALEFHDGQQVIPDDFQQYMLAQEYLEESVSNSSEFHIKLQLPDNSPWQAILPFETLNPDTYHRFKAFENDGPFTHLLYMHYPNGGVHSLKVF